MISRRKLLLSTAATAAAPSALFAGTRSDVLSPKDLTDSAFSFTDLAHELNGEKVTISGFMTPPVPGVDDLSLLLDEPKTICPVCSERAGEQAMSLCGPCSSGDGPSVTEAIAIHAHDPIRKVPYNVQVDVTGTLDVGSLFEDRTGLLTTSRLLDAEFTVAKLTSF